MLFSITLFDVEIDESRFEIVTYADTIEELRMKCAPFLI
jgi:hypothetical protein